MHNRRAAQTKRALDLIQTGLQGFAADHLANGRWEEVLTYVNSEDCVSLLRAFWPLLPHARRGFMLGAAICSGDDIRRERPWLLRVIRQLRSDGERIFYGEDAQEAFYRLPETVTIYRGTIRDELLSKRIGLSFTLKLEMARFYADIHKRFRTSTSDPIILSGVVHREQICGLITERSEHEVIILPDVEWLDGPAT